MPIRFLFMDEVDEYPGDVDGQGDPVALAEKRTATFSRRKVLLTSTPTVKGLSRIEREYLASDQRRYFVPARSAGTWTTCSGADPSTTGSSGRRGTPRPRTWSAVAAAGASRSGTRPRCWPAASGAPRPTSESRTAGFHLSALYSPLGWKSWARCAAEFLQAKEDPFRLKTWVNTVLGETWEERGDSVAAGSLLTRLERYPAEVPSGVGVLVAAVDVQGDRLEAVVKGYGAGEESWLIAFTQLHGDPATPGGLVRPRQVPRPDVRPRERAEAAGRVHRGRLRRCAHRARLPVRPRAARPARVPDQGRQRRGPAAGRIARRSTTATDVPLFVLCVDTGKDIVFSRLRIATRGPGYVHLPEWVDEEYLEQLTAEKAIRKYVKGRGAVREWIKLRERNEALDLEVYALAALHILGQAFIRGLAARAARFARAVEKGEAAASEQAPQARPRLVRPLRNDWINAWRR